MKSVRPVLPNVVFLILRRLRIPLIILIFAYAVSITGFVLIPGTRADGTVWTMSFFHAFYFVSYMGSTIGFGELPYPFNGAQRFWTLFSIYATVVAWLYAIGTMISLLQDRFFRQALYRTRVHRQIYKIREDFYLLCGHGEAGKVVTRFLSEIGEQTVVIDRDFEAINEMWIDDYPLEPLVLEGDAADPVQLQNAGLTHDNCKGVIAVIGDDQENLKIAISAKLLNPGLKVVGRVNEEDTASNMRSFGTDHIVNPFKTFAWHFSLAFSSPGHHLLNDWLSQTDYQALNDPVFPPRGQWIICGFGRFGKPLYRRLKHQNNEVTVIEIESEIANAPEGSICGRGTEAVTLNEAKVESAVGIIAGTDNDANNLSIIMTAKELNPDLFTVARQNHNRNASLFEAADMNIVFNQNLLIANQVVSLLTTPLTSEFLRLANKQNAQWANEMVSRICAIVDDNAPVIWVLEMTDDGAPAFIQARLEGFDFRLGQLVREPYNRKVRLSCVPLMLQRHGENQLSPSDDKMLYHGDRILFCGKRSARVKMMSSVSSNELLSYLITGRHRVVSPLWRKFFGSKLQEGE
ncbi:MAG: hypothetical protein DHS20C01_14140 [marine bacterium B5-7]|nr:MAG: hypothetical protein DHS20C01_14140 [marine bacterium B5-7]